jgi:hypothetical protein
MQASDFTKHLKDTANSPESLWLLFASVVFFPLVLAWFVWKLFNKGAQAFLSQSLHNTRLKHFQDTRIATLKEAHKHTWQSAKNVCRRTRKKSGPRRSRRKPPPQRLALLLRDACGIAHRHLSQHHHLLVNVLCIGTDQ